MTPRQRLTTILTGGIPDRVSVTLYEFSHLACSRPADDPGYAALIEMQRARGECFVQCPVDFGTTVGDANVVVEGPDDASSPQIRTTTIATPKGDLTSIYRCDPGTVTWWQVKPLVAGSEDCRRWLSLDPRPARPDVQGVLDLQRKTGEDGLVILGPGDALGLVCGMFHFERFVLTLLEDEGLVLAMLEAMAERLNDALRAICSQVRGVCVRFWGPEYAGAPLLDPRRYFPRLVVRFDRPAFAIVRESGNFPVLHCHGRLADLVEGIAELSPAVLEPLEVLPAATADVTMTDLKRRLGGRICLMGGIQARELERLTPAQVESRIREILQVAAPGGRFGLLPTAAPVEVPLRQAVVDNYRAYFQAAHTYGRYG